MHRGEYTIRLVSLNLLELHQYYGRPAFGPIYPTDVPQSLLYMEHIGKSYRMIILISYPCMIDGHSCRGVVVVDKHRGQGNIQAGPCTCA